MNNKKPQCLLVGIVCLFIANIHLTMAAKDEIVIGVFPRNNYTETLKMYYPLAKYLNKKMDRKIIVKTEKNFKIFWNKVENNDYDVVHYNQYHYLKSHKDHGYNIILKSEENGESTIRSVIVVKKDSNIKSLQELKNKKIIFGGGLQAMMSYIVPMNMLMSAGLKSDDFDTGFARNPPNALVALNIGSVDACGIGKPVINMLVKKKKINLSNFKILIESDSFPHLTWAVNPSLDKGTVKALTRELMGLNNTANGRRVFKSSRLTGFVKTNDSEYNVLREIVKKVTGEDL